jgi:8-oxo-dGTP pyrophosphatase MutT (NUDIX family)
VRQERHERREEHRVDDDDRAREEAEAKHESDATIGRVRREFSAGGVVVRRLKGRWHLAAIRPGGKTVWALPKGLIGDGETPAEAALRETAEETGVEGSLVAKLGDVRYVYTWEGERVFKIVSFFLLRYARGRLGDVPAEHAHEVDEARWLPLDEAPALLAYRGEKEIAEKALEVVAAEEL